MFIIAHKWLILKYYLRFVLLLCSFQSRVSFVSFVVSLRGLFFAPRLWYTVSVDLPSERRGVWTLKETSSETRLE